MGYYNRTVFGVSVLYNDLFFRQQEIDMKGQNMTIQDKVDNALERVMNKAMADDKTEVHLCTLELPIQFFENQHVANDIYKKVQSDFCKAVLRKTGETPRYVTVKTDRERPGYAFCLFTKADLDTDLVEKGREIANGKALHAGWGRGQIDVVDIVMNGPRFSVSQPLTLSSETKDTVMQRLKEHLQGKSESANHQRTLFVSSVC